MHDFRLILRSALMILVSITWGQTAAWGQAASKQAATVWLDSKEVGESSGLARSHLNDDLLWTHNDSGDKPRLFAFDISGHLHAEVEVKKASSVDWEDMCSFQWNGKAYLAVADVGDNAFARKHVTIYGMKEPKINHQPASTEGKPSKPAKESTKVDFEVQVTYPNGPLNCEAIAFDPWREQFILASKEQLRSQIFAVAFDPEAGKQEAFAQWLTTVPAPLVTGASISDDGHLLALGTYGPTCILRRTDNQASRNASWKSGGDGDLELILAPSRKQGEAICFDKAGSKLMMTSEGTPMPLLTAELKLDR